MKGHLEAGAALVAAAVRPRSGLCVLAMGLVLMIAPMSSAQAPSPAEPARDGTQSAMAMNEEGARHFEQGEYRLAVERFIHAYALTKDSNLLFNIANCYERMGDSHAAIDKYREFLAAPDAAVEGRAPAEAAITRLQAIPVLPAAARRSGDEKQKPGNAKPVLVHQHGSEAGIDLADPLPWATLGSGVVLASLGLTFYWLGARDHARVTDAPGHANENSVSTLSRAEAEELVASGKSKQAVGVTGLALGGALMAAYGAWVLWQVYDEDVDTSASSLAASPRAGGGTVTLSGTF